MPLLGSGSSQRAGTEPVANPVKVRVQEQGQVPEKGQEQVLAVGLEWIQEVHPQ